MAKANEIKIHHTHIKRIKQLFHERFSLLELYEMYNRKISFRQLRQMTKDVKRQERV